MGDIVTTRSCVELAIPARLCLSVANNKTFSCFDSLGRVTNRRAAEELLEVRVGLRSAIDEALSSLTAHQRRTAERRLTEANDAALGSMEGQPAAKAMRAILWWLQELLEAGKIELWEGSPADLAISKLMAWTQDTFDGMSGVASDRMDGSAMKNAKRIKIALARLGFYA